MNSEPAIAVPPKASPYKLVFTLGIAGFFSGLILVAVYLGTLPRIQANKAEALRKAIFQVLPGCKAFKTRVFVGGKLVLRESDSPGEGGEGRTLFAGYDENSKFLGIAIPASEPGFQDLIGVLLGYNPKLREVIGLEILESKETPGLGDKIIKDQNFRANFLSLAVEPEIVSVKTGKKSAKNEVEAITGATISSKAIVRLLNKAVAKWREPIEEWTDENE